MKINTPPSTEGLPPITDAPLGPPPSVATSDLPPIPGPTLGDAELSAPPASSVAAPEPEAPPMTNEQIIGLVAQLSSFGLSPELAEAYAADFQSNTLVQMGVQFSGLADALAEYGLTSGSGKLPPWLGVLLGVSVLGYGVYTTRGKYAPVSDSPAAAAGAGGAFGIAGGGTALSTADLGFSGASDTGGSASAFI